MALQVERERTLRDRLKGLIVECLESQSKLPTESEMMQQFNVSRAVLRDELRALEAKGIIVARQGSGRYVQIPDIGTQIVDTWSIFLDSRPSLLLDLLEIRSMLEISSLSKVINKITVEELRLLNMQTSEMMKLAMQGKNMSASDREFHRILFATLDNELLMQMLSAFWDLYEARNIASNHEGTVENAKQHQNLLDAIVSKDLERATAELQCMFEDANYRIIMALVK